MTIASRRRFRDGGWQMLKSHLREFLAAVVVLVALTYSVISAEGFRYCVDHHGEYPTNLTAPYQSPNRLISGDLSLNMVCLGAFANTYGVAITALATVLLAFVTGGLVFFGSRQLATTRAQLRAYVSAQPNFIVSFDSEHVPAVRFTMTNYGPTPAFNVRHRSEIEILPNPISGLELAPLQGTYSPPFVLFPTAQMIGTKIRDTAFSADQISQIRADEFRIYAYGELEYFDIFGRRWNTWFCSVISADEPTLQKLTSLYGPSDLKVSFQIAPIGNTAT